LNWTAQDGPGWFTGGNAGIRALVEQTGWKIIAHNRYWSPHTNYAKQNGGDWDFFIDEEGAGDMAVPLDQDFWVWLLTSSVAEWGLATYEQGKCTLAPTHPHPHQHQHPNAPKKPRHK
jgi:hypothetical protein